MTLRIPDSIPIPLSPAWLLGPLAAAFALQAASAWAWPADTGGGDPWGGWPGSGWSRPPAPASDPAA